MEENRKKLLQERKLANKIEGTNLLSSYSKFKLNRDDSSSSD
jgi:hypothetical protein